MSKIIIENFDDGGELVDFKSDAETFLVFEFTEEVEGYISLGNLTSKFKGTSCAMDIRQLDDGDYTPHLIMPSRTIDLPRLKKEYGAVTPIDPCISDINKLSLRERRLCRRVKILESQIKEITKKVYGSSLFERLP